VPRAGGHERSALVVVGGVHEVAGEKHGVEPTIGLQCLDIRENDLSSRTED
jgi:hypothetical protein